MAAALPLSPTAPPARLPAWLAPLLVLVAVLALTVPAILVRTAPRVAPVAAKVVRPTHVASKAVVPEVEPILLQNVAPQDARAYNATIPFSTAPNPAARPFLIYGSVESQMRAIDCLAAGVLYEAGDDAVGERAVAQVILNRVRHPAFPKSVCGVVFQGSERRTGCQFTFTCDGAMMRAVSPAAWDRAREIARAALNGEVYRPVGHATHYHTDWVVPYWSSSLDKIVEVHTHLFFRWTGWWGTPPAFRGTYTGAEPNVPQLARLSPAHKASVEDVAALATAAIIDPALLGSAIIPKGLEQDSGSFLVTLDAKMSPELFPALAAKACGDRGYCKFMAWTSKAATPAALPVTPVQQRAMSFSYLRDRAFGFEKALWNCAEFKRAEPQQCMKAQVSITMAPPPPSNFTYDSTPGSAIRAIAGAAAEPAKPAGPDPLTGVRRKSEPNAPVPMNGGDAPPPAPKAATPPPVKVVPTVPAAKEP